MMATSTASEGFNQDPLLGKTVGSRYAIERLIGRGGVGLVYLADDPVEQRKVVVKVLAPHWAEDPDAVARFDREALRMAKLDHPNVVKMYDHGHFEGRAYIVMEFIRGEPLRRYLNRRKRLPYEEFIPIASQILVGAGYVHERGIMMRDIKPPNIMLCEQGGKANHVKLLDFGLAKLIEEDEDDEVTKAHVIGTAAYMSPEQIRGERIDVRVDVYALGVLFFLMLTGEQPIAGDNDAAVLVNHVHGKPKSLAERLPKSHRLPSELIALIESCLAKDPDDRPASAGEMAEALFEIVPAPLLALPSANPKSRAPAETYWATRLNSGPAAVAALKSDTSDSAEWTRPLLRRAAKTGQAPLELAEAELAAQREKVQQVPQRPRPRSPTGSGLQPRPRPPTGSAAQPRPRPPTGSAAQPRPRPPTGSGAQPRPRPPTGSGARAMPRPSTGSGVHPRPRSPTGSGLRPRPRSPTGSGLEPRPNPLGPPPAPPPRKPSASASAASEAANASPATPPTSATVRVTAADAREAVERLEAELENERDAIGHADAEGSDLVPIVLDDEDETPSDAIAPTLPSSLGASVSALGGLGAASEPTSPDDGPTTDSVAVMATYMPPPRADGMRLGAIVAMAGLVALALGGITAYLVLDGADEPASPPAVAAVAGDATPAATHSAAVPPAVDPTLAEAAAGSVEVRATLEGGGARVEVDGEDRGEAPVQLELSVGDHRVRVTAPGHHPWQSTIVVKAGANADVTAELVPAEAPTPPSTPAAKRSAPKRPKAGGGSKPKAAPKPDAGSEPKPKASPNPFMDSSKGKDDGIFLPVGGK